MTGPKLRDRLEDNARGAMRRALWRHLAAPGGTDQASPLSVGLPYELAGEDVRSPLTALGDDGPGLLRRARARACSDGAGVSRDSIAIGKILGESRRIRSASTSTAG